MNAVRLIYLAAGGALCVFFGLFAVTSINEKKPRAAVISAAILVAIGLVWFGVYFLFSPSDYILIAPLVLIAIVTILYFFPIGALKTLNIGDTNQKVDERDTIFAKEEYLPGTAKYMTYYAMRPEYKMIDDRIRNLPSLLSPGGRYYDPVRSSRVKSIFGMIRKMTTQVDGEVSKTCLEVNPVEMTAKVKGFTRRLGADEVGIAKLNQMYVYSHVGRGPERWGTPIENNHQFAIVFSLEMDYADVETAPHLPLTEQSAKQYLKGAQISISLAEYIRNLGYPARAHISDSNYQIMLPPVAHDAGLGELGRIGYLISPKFGARIRLAAVTTNLPLIPDKPIMFGVQDFCSKCLKCAMNCPVGAIPKGSKVVVRGVEKWLVDVTKCIYYWRMVGTDCGICMKVCPYSHPPTFIHNLIRTGISRSSFARVVSVWGDDLFYGKQAKYDRFLNSWH